MPELPFLDQEWQWYCVDYSSPPLKTRNEHAVVQIFQDSGKLLTFQAAATHAQGRQMEEKEETETETETEREREDEYLLWANGADGGK